MRIFHIATVAEADRLRSEGELRPPSLEADGFIHCSTAEQVVATTARYFEADAELMLVELDPELVASELRWPEVYPGEHFPHLHGPLRASDVLGVLPWGRADRQAWQA